MPDVTILTKREWDSKFTADASVYVQRLEATLDAFHRYAVAAEAFVVVLHADDWNEAKHAEYEAARKTLQEAGWLP